MKKHKQADSTSHYIDRILTVAQAEAIMHAAWFHHPPCAAYFVLRIWGALRECEVRELNPPDLESSTVHAGMRTVELPQNAIKMLALLLQEGKLTREALNPSHKVVAAVIKKAGFSTAAESNVAGENKPSWTRNIMRTTALSYHFAHHKDLALTSHWAGCTSALVQSHYSLISHEDATRFWALLPS
jgi:hypothetical protein